MRAAVLREPNVEPAVAPRRLLQLRHSVEGGAEAAIDEKPEAEQRTTSTGTLRVTELDQGGSETRTLFGKFQEAGWAPRVGTATIPWREYETAAENRSLTWSGSVDNVSQLLRVAPGLGYEQRFSWPVFPRTPVDAGVTSVNVLNQTVRTLISGGTAVRAIDAVSTKPAIGGTRDNDRRIFETGRRDFVRDSEGVSRERRHRVNRQPGSSAGV